jgi:alpha-1,6-mannosyltransferase
MSSAAFESQRRARHLALGCAAGLALGSVATWARYALERTMRLETGTPAYLMAAALLGVGLGLSGACALRLLRLSPEVRLPSLLGWAALTHACAALALALTSRDLFSNLAYGEMQRLGANPYLAGPRDLVSTPLLELVAPRWLDTPNAYGPIASMASRLAAAAGAALRSPVWGAGAAFKGLMLACSLGTLLLAYACARSARGREGAEGFALLAFSPLLAWEVSAQAHNDGLLVLAIAAFVWAAQRGRERVAVLALAAGTLAKLAAAPLLGLYLAFVLRRSPRRALALLLVAAAASAVLVWPYWEGLATLQGPARTLGGDALRHAHSLADLLCIALEPLSRAAAAHAYRLCWIGSIALCLVLFVRGACLATDLGAVLHHGLVLFLAYDLTAPWFQPWYATWLLPLAAVEREPALRRTVALYAVLTVVQWAAPLDPVSTVAVNAWTALALYRARRAPPAPVSCAPV